MSPALIESSLEPTIWRGILVTVTWTGMERPFPPAVLWEEGGRTPDGHFRAVPGKRSTKDFFETDLLRVQEDA